MEEGEDYLVLRETIKRIKRTHSKIDKISDRKKIRVYYKDESRKTSSPKLRVSPNPNPTLSKVPGLETVIFVLVFLPKHQYIS